MSKFVVLMISCLLRLRAASAMGGELAFFKTPLLSNATIHHRQNVCDRYKLFQDGDVSLENALEGLTLNILVGNNPGDYFNYNEETGIDPDYPGLTAVVLDELAKRARFSWRGSFGVYGSPAKSNATWTEVLMWGVENYDIVAERWATTTARMRKGVSFMEPSLESSLIMIGKQTQEEQQGINIWNWLKPYDAYVWLMTILTILISGIVYQILEWYADERDDRTMYEWWLENTYLSFINFTQAYEYQPKTLASRLFGVSMAIWALVMTATYTANLASLLVDRSPPPPGPQTLAEAVVFDSRICVLEGAYPDEFLKKNYQRANRIQKRSIQEVFQGLNDGDCDFAVDAVAAWNRLKTTKANNPHCDLYWVGGDRRISQVDASYATKTDSGFLCSSFIGDVLSVHLRDMMESGFLRDAWEADNNYHQDIDCSKKRDKTSRRLGLGASSGNQPHSIHNHRSLKAGAGATGGAVVASSSGVDERSLTVEQMIGSFALHWTLMAIAIIIASAKALYIKFVKGSAKPGFAKALQDSSGAKSDFTEALQDTSYMGGGLSIRTEEIMSSRSQKEDKEEIAEFRRQLELMQKTQEEQQFQRQQFEERMLGQQQFQLQQFEERMLMELRNLQGQTHTPLRMIRDKFVLSDNSRQDIP